MGNESTFKLDRRQHRRARRVWRVAAIALLALAASGCGQDDNTVLTAGAGPVKTSGESAVEQVWTEPVAAPARSTDGDTGDGVLGQPEVPGDTPGEEKGSEGEGDGPGLDGPIGPVGGTDVGDDSDSPGVVPGEGDQPGGLRLMAPTPPYVAVANEVYDLCNDQDAFVAVFARALGPGEEITEEERHAIALNRVLNEVWCDDPGGKRYVYMSVVGPGGASRTVQGAIDDYKERNPYVEQDSIMYPPDVPLGYYGFLEWDFPLEDIDELVILKDTVSVRDGVVRGLVRNLSKTLFARELTVTARPADTTNQQAAPVSGRFPLTVQPGERAFFEIEGWTGSDNPDMIDLSVTANLSERVDITRAFSFGYGGSIVTRGITKEQFKNFVPPFVYEAEKHKIPTNSKFLIEHIDVSLSRTTSHPSLRQQIQNQTIEDLRVYMALFGADGTLHHIIEPLLYRDIGGPPEWLQPKDYPQVVSQPTIINGSSFYDFSITYIPDQSFASHIWVGEPGPLDYNPRSLAAPNPQMDH